jgi:hypothetical protein
VLCDGIRGKRVDAVYLPLGPSAALYLQWVCGGLDALVRQSATLCLPTDSSVVLCLWVQSVASHRYLKAPSYRMHLCGVPP